MTDQAPRHQRRIFGWLLIALGALTMGLLNLSSPEGDLAMAATAATFRGAAWASVNDTVMGGRSSATLSWTPQDHLIWSGDLSLENNGGFVSIRAQDWWTSPSGLDGVEVIIDGGGRDIQVSAQRQDMTIRAGGYRAMVPTTQQGDTHVFIPFAAFKPKRFGRAFEGPPLTQDAPSIGQWGLLIADKQPGPFSVVLKSIKPMKRPDDAQVDPAMRARLIEAIRQGVPLFNGGDASGCAAIYRQTLQLLVKGRTLGMKSWSRQVATVALRRAEIQPSLEAAWTLRGAMDTILSAAPAR